MAGSKAVKGRNWLPYFPHLNSFLDFKKLHKFLDQMRPSFAKSKFFTLSQSAYQRFLAMSESNRAPFTMTQWKRNLEIGIMLYHPNFYLDFFIVVAALQQPIFSNRTFL